MRIEHKKIVKVDELAQLVPRKAGARFSQLWQIFFYTRMFKYMHRSHYCKIKTAYNKICTDKKLQMLCELGYFTSPQKDIYCATNKVLPILHEAGFQTKLLPGEPVGKGDINELHNTAIFVGLTKVEHFHTLLFPHFGYLIPDALLVQLDKENSRCKLTFIEVEAKKPKWNEYLEDKRDKYVRLAKNIEFYNYWNEVAPILDIPTIDIQKLKFSVMFVCSIQKDFGNGFKFVLPTSIV